MLSKKKLKRKCLAKVHLVNLVQTASKQTRELTRRERFKTHFTSESDMLLLLLGLAITE